MIPPITALPLIQKPEPFSDPDWIFEVKHDGFRSLAIIEDGACQLISRKGNVYSRFKDLSRVLARLPSPMVLDGELVCLADDGRSLFHDLMFNNAPAYFYAFDILWLDGLDLREVPVIERKARLNDVVRNADCPRLLYCDHIETEGEALFSQVCQQDLEGIVAKPKDSLYRLRGRKSPWIKIKNPDYTQAEGRGDLFYPPEASGPT